MPRHRFLIGFIIITLISACVGGQEKASWTEGMRGLSKSFEDLMPYIYNKNRYSDPNNKMFIKTKLVQLNQYSSSLDKHIAEGLSGNDPLFKVGLQGLKRNIERASESYFVESYDFSQLILQSTVNYCVECHTRTNMGRTFVFYDGFAKDPALQIEKMDLAKVQVATRQFPIALETLDSFINQKNTNVDEAMVALKFMLTIAIRNQNSLKEALAITEKNIKNPVFKSKVETLKIWQKYLKQWAQVKPPMTLVKAMEPGQSENKNDELFAENVHKSLILHQQLNLTTEPKTRADILYALGRIYEQNESIGFWELPDQYFEACIQEFPYTKMAKKCYFALEARLRSNYRLDGTNVLPRLEQTHLLNLKPFTIERSDTSGGMSGGREY